MHPPVASSRTAGRNVFLCRRRPIPPPKSNACQLERGVASADGSIRLLIRQSRKQYRESVVACLPGVRKGPSSLVSNMSERDVSPSSHTKPIQTALESGAPILWGAMREGEVQDRLAAWFYRIPEVE